MTSLAANDRKDQRNRFHSETAPRSARAADAVCGSSAAIGT
jgi:hypothetical protein